MNISSYPNEDNELCNSASDLPYLQPATARQYVSAYYGETIETINPYYIEDYVANSSEKKRKTPKQIEAVLKGFVKTNTRLAKQFDKFELLTIADLKKMFPKMEQLNKKKDLVV